VKATHARGRIAVAHIGSERHARAAVAAGVDGIVHLFVGASVSPDFGEFVAKQGAFVIPTFAILKHLCSASDGPSLMADSEIQRRVKQQFRPMLSVPSPTSPLSCEGASDAVRQLVRAGALLLAGTDSPGPGTAYGASLHRELEHLVNAGAPPVTALSAATSAPARAFRMTDRGRVAPRLRADLILVNGDPSKDIRATRDIVAIWKRGVRLR
jgi:imidazolonepropionase-like amidohydrolase